MDESLLTMKEAQQRLGIHENTLYRYIKQGMLPIVVITRNKRFIRKQDLDEFITEHTGLYKQ
jgi:excisionase family DNA binding protein